MSKLVSAYLWAFRNYESGKVSVNSLKRFYPDADIFINVDYEGDESETSGADGNDRWENRYGKVESGIVCSPTRY